MTDDATHLGHVYAEHAGLGHQGATARLAQALKDDPDLAATMQGHHDRLQALADACGGADKLAQRDVMGFHHLRGLKRALGIA